MNVKKKKFDIATFAAGCFWGVEATFCKASGVVDTRVGYCGGHIPEPSYEQVCTGLTGHAETIEIRFDSAMTSYEGLLDTFWNCHDPTQLNRQGLDTGSQYRSVIFHHSGEQKEAAIASRDAYQRHVDAPVVTEIITASPFYPAEKYHQRYVEKRSFNVRMITSRS